MSNIKSNSDRTFWICFGVLIILSILACIFARFMAVFPGDVGVTLWIQSLANEPLTLTMKGISFILGGPGATITVIIFTSIAWWRIGRLEAVMILIGGIVSLLNYAFKDAINRPRPAPPLIQILTLEQQSSFPSGHSFFTFLILGLVTYFALRELPKTGWRVLFLAVAAALTLLLGLSRIYLGAHWLSDVLGGYLIGSVFLISLIRIYQAFKNHLIKVPRNSI